ncbi:MAG: hypothetical protein K2X55_15110, partial [Burkholderiaceae bacterium]|nr:hypothetical protein [Burkholderiaceae bacterium]
FCILLLPLVTVILRHRWKTKFRGNLSSMCGTAKYAMSEDGICTFTAKSLGAHLPNQENSAPQSRHM